MKAWQVSGLGVPSEVLTLAEVEQPTILDSQTLVRMEAACVGFPDYLMAQGLYHEKPPLPFVIGGEGAGRVEAVGQDAGPWKVGDRVIVVSGHAHKGHLAEYVAADSDQILPVPPDMDANHAAALFVAYQTSYVGMFRRAGLEAGETLLVHGASGGIGSAAVQLGKSAGATVIAVAGGARKVAICAELGADHVIDHTAEDFVARVKELTGGRGADVIYDSIGGDVFDRSRRCIAVEGRLLVVGFASGDIPQAPVNHALLKNYSIIGFRMRPFRDDLDYRLKVHNTLLDLYAKGEIKPLTTRYDFADAPKALASIGDRTVIGRPVIRIG
ncbi:NADPH:quinone reductase-like Zn-dependent oxidoreductase [Antricoccus suffuscus]|uniref:NADPH:quinone reductase-like Zn-dependent oxidoreductase n=1 Tax=Antricoccus suffuscus TaxID=1629062 RepID=A0A2T1A673_9ACTN|nr:NADPH:quinone oxidoreductase family protein [Antricoccus suffuscus]PRZ43977.1 NADPH:quinone reductase-like Zn-dependent oxidoreductase [Antricoccus suffuscus]